MGQRAIFKRAKNPLKWDSAHTKIWEWDISREICVKNDENRGQSKKKGKGKKENSKNDYFRSISGVKIRLFAKWDRDFPRSKKST